MVVDMGKRLRILSFLILSCCAIAFPQNNGESAEEAIHLNNEAISYWKQGNYQKAAEYGEKAVKIFKALNTADIGDNYLTATENLSEFYYQLYVENEDITENINKSVEYQEQYANLVEKAKGADSKEYYDALGVLYSRYWSQFNYLGAKNTLEKRLKLNARKDAAYYADVEKLASVCLFLGEYGEASDYETIYSNYIKETQGADSRAYLNTLMQLANYTQKAGFDGQAAATYEEALLVSRNIGDKDAEFRITGYLAFAYSRLFDYEKAVMYQERVTGDNARSHYLTEDSFYEEVGLLAEYCYKSGEYDKAIECLSKIWTSASNVRKQPITMINLSRSYAAKGDYIKALETADSIYSAMKAGEMLDSDLFRWTVVGEMIDYNIRLGNTDAADVLLSEYGDICGRFGYDFFKATMLQKLSLIQFKKKDYEKACSNMKEAISITEKEFGKDYAGYDEDLLHLLIFNYYEGSKEKLAECADLYVEAVKKTVLSAFTDDRTSEERSLLWKRHADFFNFIPKIALLSQTAEANKTAYNSLLFSKGILLQAETGLSELIKQSGNGQIKEDYGRLLEEKHLLNSLYQDNSMVVRSDIDSALFRIGRLERKLVAESKEFGDYTANLMIDWEDVRDALDGKDAAIEFCELEIEDGVNVYVALVLRKYSDAPELIPLFFESALGKINRLYYSSPALYDMLWKPLESVLDGVENVYFAPAGELYNIAMESLPKNDSVMASDVWNLYRLSSTRQIAIDKEEIKEEKAAVYGGLKYNINESSLIADSRRYVSTQRSQMDMESFLSDMKGLRNGVNDLPGTAVEAKEIDNSLKSAEIDTRIYVDTLGTEASLKALSGKGVNILHIATHGFYWTEREASRMDFVGFLMRGDDRAAVEDKALTRSGLLFAGANNALQGKTLPDGVEDGILTAQEIASLDFNGLDLVVLSACQTGLGEITGDGVFGLQRGFKKAGAGTLLMSLWKVDDDATRLLMTRFYHNLLSGMSKYESLKEAQRYVRDYAVTVEVKPDVRPAISAAAREEARKRRQAEKEYKTVQKYRDPYYWAGFILLDAR